MTIECPTCGRSGLRGPADRVRSLGEAFPEFYRALAAALAAMEKHGPCISEYGGSEADRYHDEDTAIHERRLRQVRDVLARMAPKETPNAAG